MYPYPKPSSSGGGQKGSSSFPCHICGLEFPKRRYLRDHMRKKHSDHDIVSVADDMKVTNELMKKDVQALGEKEKTVKRSWEEQEGNKFSVKGETFKKKNGSVIDCEDVDGLSLKTQGKQQRMLAYKRKSKYIQIHDVRSHGFWATWRRSPSLSGR